MTPVYTGKFCASCQKKVHDFTLASDREILEVIRKSPDSCGRFLNTQLNRELVAPEKKSTIWQLVAASVVTTFVAGNQVAMAQGEPKTVQTDSKPMPEEMEIVGKPMPTTKTISGVVSDDAGPLPSANVIIERTRQGVQTDIDGKFSIDALEGDTLIFSFVGMKDEQITIDTVSKYDVTLKAGNILGGEIIVVTGGFKRRTFMGRLFRRVGNVFR